MTRLLNRAAPYLLALPAWIWLGLFFVVPIVGLLWMSLMTGNIIVGFQQTFNVGIYPEVITTYWEHILRSSGMDWPPPYCASPSATRWPTGSPSTVAPTSPPTFSSSYFRSS